MKNVIYQILCVANGAIYIGSARNLYNRTKAHLALLRSGKHGNRYLQAIFSKHGEDSLQFIAIEQVESSDLLIAAEQRHMDNCRANGLRLINVCQKAGSKLGTKDSPATIEKKRKNFLGRKHTTKTIALLCEIAKKRGNYGVSSRQSVRDKRSLMARGKPQPKHLVGLMNGNRNAVGNKYRLGVKHTEETKKKISDSRLAYLVKKKAAEQTGVQ